MPKHGATFKEFAISAKEKWKYAETLQMRRLTRLTNGFSKNWENPRVAYALHFAYYNFCRIHSSIRCTPAMEAGITKGVWSIQDLLTA